MHCGAGYQEQKIERHPSARAWAQVTVDEQVMFDSYDGNQVVGSFSDILPSITGDPPVTVQGNFSGRVDAAN